MSHVIAVSLSCHCCHLMSLFIYETLQPLYYNLLRHQPFISTTISSSPFDLFRRAFDLSLWAFDLCCDVSVRECLILFLAPLWMWAVLILSQWSKLLSRVALYGCSDTMLRHCVEALCWRHQHHSPSAVYLCYHHCTYPPLSAQFYFQWVSKKIDTSIICQPFNLYHFLM